MKKIYLAIMLLTMAVWVSCKKDLAKQVAANDAKLKTLSLPPNCIADFEADGGATGFTMSDTLMNDTTLDNPQATGNSSLRCGRIHTTSASGEILSTDPLDGTFALTSSDRTITMKVLTPNNNYSGLVFTLSLRNSTNSSVLATKTTTQSVTANTWYTLTFTFTATSDKYDIIDIAFPDPATGTKWYFDDINVPTITYPTTLFNRLSIGSEPAQELGLFLRRASSGTSWYHQHVAAANILTPSETADGKWHMYVRGSNGASSIGVFTASTTGFDPTLVGVTGGWQEFGSNPIISPSTAASGTGHQYEAKSVANPVAVVNPTNGNIYVYYMAKDINDVKSICMAKNDASTDPSGTVFTKSTSNPLVEGKFALGTHYGTTTSVLYNAADVSTPWYHFSHGGDNSSTSTEETGESRIWLTKQANYYTVSDPSNPSGIMVDLGTTPAYDSKSIEAGRIFSISSDTHHKYMIYSCSSTWGDYPNRFNIAISGYDDLAHWTKLTPAHPTTYTPYVFLRGRIGQWDQGANWSCDILEKGSYLYMYYEGWGCTGTMLNRSIPYSGPNAHSQLGVARVSLTDFQNWVADCPH